MDVAGGAIAVITISLQSTKFIYQAVEEIRNGPVVVAELASRTRRLEALLQQLLDLIRHSQHAIPTQDQDVWKSLEHEISQCSAYLNEAADKLKKLDSSLASHRIGKTWRRIKGSLKDKDLERMSEQMQNYVAMLNVQLLIINSRLGVLREVYEGRQLDNAQKVNEDLMQLTTAVHCSIEKNEQTSGLTREVIQNTSHLLVERMNNKQADLRRNTEEVSGNITTRLARLENLSTGQSETIIDLLRQIQLQSSLKHAANDTNSVEARLPDVKQDPEADLFAQHGLTLSAAINRLCLLASNRDTVCYSEEAENIIDDLGCVLDAIMNQYIRSKGENSRNDKRKRSDPDEEQSHDLHRHIKRMRGILSASQAVELNGNNITRHRYDARSERKKMTSKHFAQTYDMVDCTALLSFRTYNNNESGRQVEPTRLHMEDVLSSMQGSISILPKTNPRPFKILISFLQRLTSSGFSCVNPGLLFHPVVPGDAEIFEAVKTGDVDRMLELLNTGKASLRDCDSKGRSLLNYAIERQQLSSCRFLVGRGADVDSLERHFVDYDDEEPFYAYPLNQQEFKYCVSHYLSDQFRDYLAIKQCLLEHDADPVVVIPDNDITVFDDVVVTSRPESLSLTLKYGQIFIDLNKRDQLGRNFILRMLAWCPSYGVADVGKQPEHDVILKIQILRSYGVEIDSKDNNSKGCLHTLLDRGPYSGPDVDRLIADAQMMIGTLSYLIDMGADIHAVHGGGLSVTEMAHNYRFGRLWEAALDRSGLNILQVYLDDHHSTSRYSDDIYAPDENHPRQVRPLLNNSAYYDSEDMDPGVRHCLLYERLEVSGFELFLSKLILDTEISEDDDNKASDWSEGFIIEDYNEESRLSAEQCSQISGEDQPDASAEEESSDEETGGVSIPHDLIYPPKTE